MDQLLDDIRRGLDENRFRNQQKPKSSTALSCPALPGSGQTQRSAYIDIRISHSSSDLLSDSVCY